MSGVATGKLHGHGVLGQTLVKSDLVQKLGLGFFLQGWVVGLYSKCGRLMAYYVYYSIDAPPMRQCRL